MGDKRKALFLYVALDSEKLLRPWPDDSVQNSTQFELPAAWARDTRSLQFTSMAFNKNAILPCKRTFSPLLRGMALNMAMLPARETQKPGVSAPFF
jgi:hypothetical protein